MRRILVTIVLFALSSCDAVYAAGGSIVIVKPDPTAVSISTAPGTIVTVTIPGPQGPPGKEVGQAQLDAKLSRTVATVSTTSTFYNNSAGLLSGFNFIDATTETTTQVLATSQGASLTASDSFNGTVSSLVAQGNGTIAATGIMEFNGTARITPEGGFATKFTAGENLVKGEVVAVLQAGGTDGWVYKLPTGGNENDMAMGIVYASAVVGTPVWIVTTGQADVLPDLAITAARGYVLYSSSTTAGRAAQSAAAPSSVTHFKEIGHWVNTGTGNGALTRAVIHFN